MFSRRSQKIGDEGQTDCKVAGRKEEESILLALKSEALLKLAEFRASGHRDVIIGMREYWDGAKEVTRQKIIFVVRQWNGEYYSSRSPREKLPASFDPHLGDFDDLPQEVIAREIEFETRARKI